MNHAEIRSSIVYLPDVIRMSLLQHHISLKEHNTFGIECTAALFAEPSAIEEISDIIKDFDHRSYPFLVIGEGSNLLFRTDFEGLVLRPRFSGIEKVDETEDHVLVRVGAGVNWDSWVEYASGQGWYGLENLSLIPGTVGSAPIQNIGAYGIELKDYFYSLEAYDLESGRLTQLTGEECHFGYRSSIFKSTSKGRYIVTSVTFRLNRKPELKLQYGKVQETFASADGKTPGDLRKVIISIRESKLPDPGAHGNAGSYFKNPLVDRTIFKCIRIDYQDIPNYPDTENKVKIPAAWLIDKAGWKGKRLGAVGTWPTQPLVIVNYGGATGEEILAFSEQIREDVDQKFGVLLEREVNVV